MVAGYALERRLGSGSFATVYRGVKVIDSTGTTESAAIKAITRSSEKLTKKVLENLELEISILRKYRHPNIVCLHDVQKTERHFYLILEYCAGGDLQRLIRTRKAGRLTERLTRRLVRDLTAGLKFLWGQELIHRDIKPQNLLLTGPLPMDELHDPAKSAADEEERQKDNFPSAQFALKLADFGFARHLQTTSLAETLCGSPLYMAPEILQHQRYDAKADLWSVGTVLFEMISGRPPFHGENHIDLLRNIQRKAVRLPADVRVSKECVNLLRLLLNRNPLTRAGFKEFFDASDAFVGLGCEGEALQPTEDSGSMLQKPSGLLPLGPISEGDESQMHGAGSMATIATAAAPAVNTYQRQRSGRDSERNTPNSSPPTSQYEERPTPTMPATTTTAVAPSTPMNVVSPPLAPATAPPIAVQPALMPSNTPYAHGGQLEHQRRGSHFAPLQPSPPGPSAYYAAAIPPPMSLDGGLPRHLPAHGHNAMIPSSHDQGYPGQHQPRHQQRGDSSQSSSDDSGFVMVQHGGSPSASTSPAASHKGSDQSRHNHHQQAVSSAPKIWKQTAPGSRFVHRIQSAVSPPASPGRSSSHSNTVIPSRRSSSHSNTSSPYTTKGILSTSPSTGGALVGMMGGMIGMAIGSGQGGGTVSQRQKEGTVDNSNTEQFQTISKFETIGNRQQGSGTSNIKLAAKMLSAAEDVGRRAVTVAHLGDTRAYLAMRLIMAGSLHSSSSAPMEGVEEETEEQCSDGGDTRVATGRRRAVPASMEEDDDEEDDEMPFAISADSDTDPSGALSPMLAAHVSRGSSLINPKRGSVGGNRPSSSSSSAMIQAHFREALSCYVKALSMIKSAVGATQRVSVELNLEGQASTASGPKSSPPDSNHLASLKRRCEVGHGWLTGQFKGVLERADAANAKIAELDKTAQESTAASTGSGGSTSGAAAAAPSSTTSSTAAIIAKVEELIYNHSLACGRDGAVKQLLGQNEVARSCYRSAGLLAETLLMETKLGDDDKTILENLVEGFAERITELDTIMLQQSRGSSTVGSGTSTSLQALRRSSSLPKGGGLNSVAEHAHHGQDTDEDQHQALQHTETY